MKILLSTLVLFCITVTFSYSATLGENIHTLAEGIGIATTCNLSEASITAAKKALIRYVVESVSEEHAEAVLGLTSNLVWEQTIEQRRVDYTADDCRKYGTDWYELFPAKAE